MIGLISPNLSSVNNWRNLTKVSPAISPWLSSREQILGLRLTSVICLPGWQDRPGNHTLLSEAARLLIVPMPDPEDVEAERSTPINILNDSFPTTIEEPGDGAALTFIAPADWSTPPADDLGEGIRRLRDIESRWVTTTTHDPVPLSLGDADDRAVARSFVSDALYERMTQDERSHLMSLIRAPGTGARSEALQFARSVRRRLNDPEAEATVDAQRRLNRINNVLNYVGEEQREFLTALPMRDIEHLARRVQLIQISTGDNATEEHALFREYWERLRERDRLTQDTPPRTAEGVPTQRVARPPTSGPPTGGRAVGRSIPFADVFAPPRRRRTTDNGIF